MDQEPGVKLTVSDIRTSILHNLHERFDTASIRNYESRMLDLTNPVSPNTFAHGEFDVVVCRYAFHHFAEPPHVLSEMVRVCAPQGTVAIEDLIAGLRSTK